MASQSSQEEVGDARFAELLKPIKDLTQNWQVPLADILSNYMEELHHVEVTFDGGQTSVNFAQAALVLQGTASVYCKKVDFLWGLLNKMIDMLHSKKGGEADAAYEGGEGGGGGRRRRRCVDMTAEFEDLVAVVAKNIDLKGDDETLEERQAALNFIQVTPRQLIEKGETTGSIRVNLYTGVAASKWDLLAAKEDFRLNSQFVSATGCLGEELTSDGVYVALQPESMRLGEVREEARRLSEVASKVQSGNHMAEDGLEDIPEEPMEDYGDDGLDVLEVSEHIEGQEAPRRLTEDFVSSLQEAPEVRVTPPRLRRTGSLPQKPAFIDPWTPLDINAPSTPRPIGKGKTIRLPPSMIRKHAEAKGKRPKEMPKLPSIQDFLVTEMTCQAFTLPPGIPPCFYDLAAEEAQRRKKIEKERMKIMGSRKGRASTRRGDHEEAGAGGAEEVNQGELEQEGENEDHFDTDDVHGGEVDDDENEAIAALPNIAVDDWDEVDAHLGGEVGAAVVGEDEDSGQTQEEEAYEDMVARRVAEYVAQGRQHLLSSALTQRVSAWHNMIGPKLEAVEQRKNFDIHEYGSKILRELPERETEGGEGVFKPFTNIVGGLKREEVCRFFLSSLMLANTGNVEISKGEILNPDEDCVLERLSSAMDLFTLSLLSTTRHHEQLSDFQASSQQGPSASRHQSKRPRAPDSPPRPESQGDQEQQSPFRVPAPPQGKRGRKKT